MSSNRSANPSLSEAFIQGDLGTIIEKAKSFTPTEFADTLTPYHPAKSYYQALQLKSPEQLLLQNAALNKHQNVLNYCFNIFIQPEVKDINHLLHFAILCNQSPDTIMELLKKGADINAPLSLQNKTIYTKNSSQRTPLDHALVAENIELAVWLISLPDLKLQPYSSDDKNKSVATPQFHNSNYYNAVMFALKMSSENKFRLLEALYTFSGMTDLHIETAILALRHHRQSDTFKHFNEVIKLNYKHLSLAINYAMDEYTFYMNSKSLYEPIRYLAAQPVFLINYNASLRLDLTLGNCKKFEIAIQEDINETLKNMNKNDILYPLTRLMLKDLNDNMQASGFKYETNQLLPRHLLMNAFIEHSKDDPMKLVTLIDLLATQPIYWPPNSTSWKKELANIKFKITGIEPPDPVAQAKIEKWKLSRNESLVSAEKKRAEDNWLWFKPSPDEKEQNKIDDIAPEQEMKDMRKIQNSQAQGLKKS